METMAGFSAVSILSADAREWNECVNDSQFGYTYDFYEMLIQCEYDESENYSFAVRDMQRKTIVLVFPLVILKGSRRKNIDGKKTTVISRYGPVIRNGISKKEKEQVKGVMLGQLRHVLEKYKKARIRVELPALCEYNFPHKCCNINPLLFWGFKPTERYTWIIDLRCNEDELLGRCNRSTRKSIRRYIRENVYVVRESDDSTENMDCEHFKRLCTATYSRNGMRTKSDSYLTNQFHNIGRDMRRVFFVGNSPGMNRAAAMVHTYKKSARFTWVVSEDEKEKDIVKYLMYKSMIFLKNGGIEYIEIGGAYLYMPYSSKKRRISDFKESFGGYLHPIYGGVFRWHDY